MFDDFNSTVSGIAVALTMATQSVAGEVPTNHEITDIQKACITTVVDNLYEGDRETAGDLDSGSYSTRANSEQAEFISTINISPTEVVFQTTATENTIIPNPLRSMFGFPAAYAVESDTINLQTGESSNVSHTSHSGDLNKATSDNNARLQAMTIGCLGR